MMPLAFAAAMISGCSSNPQNFKKFPTLLISENSLANRLRFPKLASEYASISLPLNASEKAACELLCPLDLRFAAAKACFDSIEISTTGVNASLHDSASKEGNSDKGLSP